MGIEFRRASIADIPRLIRIRMMAHGGMNEALYENLDQSVGEIIERDLSNPTLTDYYRNYWVAHNHNEVVGGLHSFPCDDFENDIHNPLVPEERYLIESPFLEIDALGTYYINALTVFPEFTRQGIGSLLVKFAQRLAVERGFTELGLHVFAENSGAVSLYKKHGYREIGRRPLIPHPRMVFFGDILLMTCKLKAN
jgi:GNAT superfamily N-acetyltransferase